jgi:hypothetical protein
VLFCSEIAAPASSGEEDLTNCVKDYERNGGDISKLEDLEFRMDLTDDFLHIVRHRKIIPQLYLLFISACHSFFL